MDDVLEVHQVVRCIIVHIRDANSKYIVLSSRCSLVNRSLAFKHFQKGMSLSTVVSSKEDHG